MKEKGRLNRRVGRYKLICEGVGKVERWEKNRGFRGFKNCQIVGIGRGS